MEPFDINISGDLYTIQPLISENYEVYQSDQLLGFLTPTLQGEETVWSSREIEQELAARMGEQIDEVRG
jgi:hypothetical protein